MLSDVMGREKPLSDFRYGAVARSCSMSVQIDKSILIRFYKLPDCCRIVKKFL